MYEYPSESDFLKSNEVVLFYKYKSGKRVVSKTLIIVGDI